MILRGICRKLLFERLEFGTRRNFGDALVVEPFSGHCFGQSGNPFGNGQREARQLPDPCGSVSGSRRDSPPIRTELGGPDASRMFQRLAQGLAGFGVPHAGGLVPRCGQHPLSVRAELGESPNPRTSPRSCVSLPAGSPSGKLAFPVNEPAPARIRHFGQRPPSAFAGSALPQEHRMKARDS